MQALPAKLSLTRHNKRIVAKSHLDSSQNKAAHTAFGALSEQVVCKMRKASRLLPLEDQSRHRQCCQAEDHHHPCQLGRQPLRAFLPHLGRTSS